MGTDAEARPFAILFALVALSLVIVIGGFVLRGRGQLRTPRAALIWAVLCIVPLFGAGLLFFGKHVAEHATGVTQPGVSGNALAPSDR
jgi:hypothetical protein